MSKFTTVKFEATFFDRDLAKLCQSKLSELIGILETGQVESTPGIIDCGEEAEGALAKRSEAEHKKYLEITE